MSNELKAAMKEGREFIAANLPACCAEELEWQQTSILRDGKFREAAAIFAKVDKVHSLQMAQSEITRQAMEVISRTPPAASGQQEVPADGWALPDVIEALRASGFEVRGEDATAIVYGTVEAGAVLLDASIEVFSQPENKGLELPDDHPISVHLRGLGIEPAAHPAPVQQESETLRYAKHIATSIWQGHYKDVALEWSPFDDLHGVLSQIDNMTCGMRRAPASAALTDEQIDALIASHGTGGWQTTDDMRRFARAILATASAAPAEQARDAEIETLVAALQDCARHPRKSQRDNIVSKALAAIASQQKGGDGHG